MASAPIPPAGRSPIEALIADEDASWNRGVAAGLTARARADVRFTNIVGMHSIGKAAFVKQHERIFATIYKGSRNTQQIVHIALVRLDVAIVDTLADVSGCRWLPEGAVASDGVLRTRLQQVLVREADGWWIAAFHNVAVHPQADTPTA